MRTVLISLATLGAAACAAPAEPASAVASAKAECPLLVRFGSYASGIDGEAAGFVRTALHVDPRVAGVTERPWGREGERDLCVALRRAEDGPAVVETVQGALPRRRLNGYLDILLDGRRVFSTQTPG